MKDKDTNQQKDQVFKTEVIDLASFRKQKETTEELSRGRKPLYVSHSTGKVTGSPHFKRPDSPDFGDRLQRIRSSLDKINRLMTELKTLSKKDERSTETNIRK